MYEYWVYFSFYNFLLALYHCFIDLRLDSIGRLVLLNQLIKCIFLVHKVNYSVAKVIQYLWIFKVFCYLIQFLILIHILKDLLLLIFELIFIDDVHQLRKQKLFHWLDVVLVQSLREWNIRIFALIFDLIFLVLVDLLKLLKSLS